MRNLPTFGRGRNRYRRADLIRVLDEKLELLERVESLERVPDHARSSFQLCRDVSVQELAVALDLRLEFLHACDLLLELGDAGGTLLCEPLPLLLLREHLFPGALGCPLRLLLAPAPLALEPLCDDPVDLPLLLGSELDAGAVV